MKNTFAHSAAVLLSLPKKGIFFKEKQMLTLFENGRCVYAYDNLFLVICTKKQLDFGICRVLTIFVKTTNCFPSNDFHDCT